MKYVKNATRSERPFKATPEMKEAILNNVQKNRHEREKTSAMLSVDHDMCSTIVLKILKKNEFRACKSTKKSDLSLNMKEARLKFCFEHRD